MKPLDHQNNKMTSNPVFRACHFINEEHNQKHSRLIHSHDDFMELLYVYDGEGKYWVDNIRYEIKTGDIVICNAGILHGEDPQDERRVRSYSVGIGNVSYPGLPENWLCRREVYPIIHCEEHANHIRQMFAFVYSYTNGGRNITETAHILAYALLQLSRELLTRDERLVPEHKSSSAHASAERIRLYINAHYKEALTLESLTEALNMTESYLSHLFKDEYGMSPINYAMKRRIGEAQGLLMDSSLPIADISDRMGFGDTAHFTRMFKKYVGMPPGQYRESFKEMKE